MAGRFVAVEQDGVVEVHAVRGGGGDYATMCGIDGDDDGVGQRPVPLPPHPKINCPDCIAIIRTAKQYKERDMSNDH